MSRAEFEEKEYEQAANLELCAGGGFVMSPGQVLERLVSYDAVAAPIAGHVIWQILNHPRPKGVRLLPSHWAATHSPPANRLPEHPISMMLQYKRPEYLNGARAAQWNYWRVPYYRFQRTDEQHRVLRRLDRSLEGVAVVRYAAPAFWKFSHLEAAVLTRQVLQRTGFVRPIDLKHHQVWTYVEPGTAGRANPTGRRLLFADFDQLWAALTQQEVARLPARVEDPLDRLAVHLAEVAEACRSREPGLRRAIDAWLRSIGRSGIPLSTEGTVRIGDLVTVSTLTSQLNTTWTLVDAFEPPRLPG